MKAMPNENMFSKVNQSASGGEGGLLGRGTWWGWRDDQQEDVL